MLKKTEQELADFALIYGKECDLLLVSLLFGIQLDIYGIEDTYSIIPYDTNTKNVV